MRNEDFSAQVGNAQADWRKTHVSNQEFGTHKGVPHAWILREQDWKEGLWPGIRDSLPAYLERFDIEKHRDVHNLKSSWMLCANLFFPFRDADGHALLTGFLRERGSPDIRAVIGIELEYAEEPPLDPKTLFAESARGKRGAYQTSPDVAFVVTTANGRGLILTEIKFTEHHFYPCPAYRDAGIVHRQYCQDWTMLKDEADRARRCWHMNWAIDGKQVNRRYWEHIRPSDHGQLVLKRCPAATDGYQLFRQQALAEAIARSDKYQLVISAVAYDEGNSALLRCLNGTTDVEDFTIGWGPLFSGRARFCSWTHQQWVAWVREHDRQGGRRDWLTYIEERYGY